MNKYIRLEELIGKKLDLLKDKSILVLGLGGVGGYVVESLARSGFKNIIIVDNDLIEESNINRQIIALDSTINKYKTDEIEKRIKDIDNNINVIKIKEFIDNTNYKKLYNNKIDFFVDCCDTTNTKKIIIKECINNNIPFISCMGTGNRLDPSKLEIIDIRKTSNDPLARIIRKFVKDEKINKKVLVCTSSEVPIKTKDNIVSSSIFVPASAGLLIGSYILKYFVKNE